MNYGEGIYKIIFDLYANQSALAQNYANLVEPMIRTGAAIGAIIYIFSRLIPQIVNNQEIDFLSYFRPFLILLLIPFSSKICTSLDTLGENIRSVVAGQNANIADRVQKNSDKIQSLVDKKWEKIANDPEKYQAAFGSDLNEDKSGLFGETAVDLKIGLYRFSEDFKFQILAVVQSILVCLMYIAECCLLLISIGFRIILRIGFPITVALCIFPGFTSALANWFGKYLNYALLPAVAAMYSSIAFTLSDTYLSSYDVEAGLSTMGIETQQPEFLGLAYIGILILSLIGYLQVPSMTSMLISVGGVGQMIQAATRSVQNVPAIGSKGINTAGSIANSAISGATSVAGTVATVGKSTVFGAVGGGIDGVKGGDTAKSKVSGGLLGTIKGTVIGAISGVEDASKKRDNKTKKSK